MIELIAELELASKLLETALDRYFNACAAIEVCFTHPNALTNVPQILSDGVAREMTRVSLYEVQARRVKSIIGRARNFSAALVPIHSLPSELLARIFLLVVDESCGITADSTKSRHMPRYPDFLSHTCSRWRSVAINLPALWTHIDLVYYHSSDQMYVNRAEVFASRAAPLPLDIHLRAPTPPDMGRDPYTLYDFLPSITARARSLDLITVATPNEFDNELFETLFSIFKPATLLRFGITDHGDYTPGYLYASHDDNEELGGGEPDYDCQHLDIANELFEGLLRPVRVLRLDGLYPHWASQAYHDLVELRLEDPKVRVCGVSAARLHSIFMSSPRLVTLHLGLEIFRDGFQSISTPAYLGDLETLNVGGLVGVGQLELLLKLLTPGPKPLQLTVSLCGQLSFSDRDDVVTRFLRDSNIVRLCLRGLDRPTVVDHLLHLLPQLQSLALSGYYLVDPVGPFISSFEPNRPPFNLETLYLEQGRFDLSSLCLLAKTCSPQTIVLWRTQVCRDDTMLEFDDDFIGESEAAFEEVAEFRVREALSVSCPLVKHTRYDMDKPTKHWGFRD